MTTPPEFSRPIRIDTLGPEPRQVALVADIAERAALARRFGLVAIARLEAKADVRRSGEKVSVTGALQADVTQSCVATGDPIDTVVEEDFRIEFRPCRPARAEEEIELKEDELDVLFHDGVAVDLGEAVAETLPLALDPYPRSAGADEILREAGVKGEAEAKAEASPFAALAALKDKLGK